MTESSNTTARLVAMKRRMRFMFFRLRVDKKSYRPGGGRTREFKRAALRSGSDCIPFLPGSGRKAASQKEEGGRSRLLGLARPVKAAAAQLLDSAFLLLALALAFFLPSDLAAFLLSALAGIAGVADCAGVAGVAGACAATLRVVPANAASIRTAIRFFM